MEFKLEMHLKERGSTRQHNSHRRVTDLTNCKTLEDCLKLENRPFVKHSANINRVKRG